MEHYNRNTSSTLVKKRLTPTEGEKSASHNSPHQIPQARSAKPMSVANRCDLPLNLPKETELSVAGGVAKLINRAKKARERAIAEDNDSRYRELAYCAHAALFLVDDKKQWMAFCNNNGLICEDETTLDKTFREVLRLYAVDDKRTSYFFRACAQALVELKSGALLYAELKKVGGVQNLLESKRPPSGKPKVAATLPIFKLNAAGTYVAQLADGARQLVTLSSPSDKAFKIVVTEVPFRKDREPGITRR